MSESATSVLPDTIKALVELLGYPLTMKLVETHGGTRLKVPKGRQQQKKGRDVSAELVELLGSAPAAVFMGTYGGERLDIPRCAALLQAERNKLIVEAYGRGKAVHELAREYSLGERQIWNILKKPLPDTTAPTGKPAWMANQKDLFDAPSTTDEPA